MSFGTHLPYEEFEKKFLIEFQMVCADYGITIFVTNKKRDLEGRCSDSWWCLTETFQCDLSNMKYDLFSVSTNGSVKKENISWKCPLENSI